MQDEIKAEFVIRDLQEYIKVIFPSEEEVNLWQGIIAHCAKRLSDNEMKQIYICCKNQLDSMRTSDIPPVYNEMMAELEGTLAERKIKITEEKQIDVNAPRYAMIGNNVGKTFKKFGSLNTETGELDHIYDSQAQVRMCFSDGADNRKDIDFVEVEVKIVKKINKR